MGSPRLWDLHEQRELAEHTLHYWFLAPVRREVLVLGKFLAGVLTTVLVFGAGILASFCLMYVHFDAGHDFVRNGPGLAHLRAYLLVATLACLGYGAVFLATSLLFKNPIVPAVVLLFWEGINGALPVWLKRISVTYYLKPLFPVELPIQSFLGLFTVVAEPTLPWLAVSGLLAVQRRLRVGASPQAIPSVTAVIRVTIIRSMVRTWLRRRRREKLDGLIKEQGSVRPFPVLFEILQYHGYRDAASVSDACADTLLCWETLAFVREYVVGAAPRMVVSSSNKYFLDDRERCVTDTILKKMTVFAENVALFRPYLFRSEFDERGHAVVQDPEIAVSKDFLQDLFLYEPFLRAGALWILPPETEIGAGPGQLTRGAVRQVIEKGRIALSHQQLRTQLQEDLTEVGTGLLYLPHLLNVPAATLMKIRRDEGDAFLRFQNALRRLWEQSRSVRNEDALLDLMKQVDDEVRLLNTRFEKIRKMRAFQGRSVLVQLFSLALVQLVAPGLAKDLAPLLGGPTVYQTLQYFASSREKLGDLKESAFYFPWRIAQG